MPRKLRRTQDHAALTLELRCFYSLRPRLHPWIEIIPRENGSAEFYDFITNRRLKLNSTAYSIVERMRSGEQTLGEIATSLAAHYGKDERELLDVVVKIYKLLEYYDETIHPFWRYMILYAQHLKCSLFDNIKAFFQIFFKGMGSI